MRKLQKKGMALGLALACLGFFGLDRAAQAAAPDSGGQSRAARPAVQKVVSVARVYGDGEKVAEAVLQYRRPLDPDSVQTGDFTVEGHAVTDVAVNREPYFTGSSRPGRFVILKLATENTADEQGMAEKPQGEPGKEPAFHPDASHHSDLTEPDLAVAVRQVGEVTTVRGRMLGPSQRVYRSTETRKPDVDVFTQYQFKDPVTGVTMPYNLYLPAGYQPDRKYPLVFFVPDMGVNNNDTTAPLYQGNGATVFASPERQRKDPAIVLAPQYTDRLVGQLGLLTDDTYTWTQGLGVVSRLLFHVLDNYNVDRTRVYGTGQSQGGMTNIALSDRYPDLFAAQYLVACQWNVDEMKGLKDKKLWITVCEGDTKAYPGMNAATAEWEKLGTAVARNKQPWDAKAPAAQLDREARELAAQGAPINYTVFAGGNHRYTWSFAYNIPFILDWMFAQHG